MEPKKQIWVFGVQKFKDVFEKDATATRLYLNSQEFLFLTQDEPSMMMVILSIDKVLDKDMVDAFIEQSTLEFINSTNEKLLFLIGPWLRDQVNIRELFNTPVVSSIDIYFKIGKRDNTDECSLEIANSANKKGKTYFEFNRIKDQDTFFGLSPN